MQSQRQFTLQCYNVSQEEATEVSFEKALPAILSHEDEQALDPICLMGNHHVLCLG